MKLNMKSLRAEVWRVLTREVTGIYLEPTKDSCVAWCSYDDKSIEIHCDTMDCGVESAVIHEILHKLLDSRFVEAGFTYHLYEHFINSLERPFFKGMTLKERKRWTRAIQQKIVQPR